MGQGTAEVRQQIEMTRGEMSGTIDAIADRTSPARIAGRQRRRMSDRVHRVREMVMGTAEDAYGSAEGGAHGMAYTPQHGIETALQDVGQAPDAVKRQTQGSPLAAGLIAFGAGALAAAVFPSTHTERQAAARLEQETQPAMEQFKQAGQQVAEGVKGSTQQAVEEVKTTATDAAHQVADEAKSAAQDVKEEGQGTAERVAEDTKQAAQEVRSGDDSDPNRSEL